IYIMRGATLEHEEVAHQLANKPIDISAKLTISESSLFQSIKVFYRLRGQDWDSLSMTNAGGFNFTAQLPGIPSYNIVDYYFKVYDVIGNSTYGFPNGYNTTTTLTQVTIPYQFAVGIREMEKVDFETDPVGWTIGNASGDNASNNSVWVR